MVVIKTISAICVLFFCAFVNIGIAAEQPTWSVQFDNETAIIRASKITPTKYIHAAISALKDEGVEKFALKVLQPKEEQDSNTLAMVVRIIEKDAELILSPDLPHKYLIATIRHLNEVGIEEVKITLSKQEPKSVKD